MEMHFPPVTFVYGYDNMVLVLLVFDVWQRLISTCLRESHMHEQRREDTIDEELVVQVLLRHNQSGHLNEAIVVSLLHGSIPLMEAFVHPGRTVRGCCSCWFFFFVLLLRSSSSLSSS